MHELQVKNNSESPETSLHIIAGKNPRTETKNRQPSKYLGSSLDLLRWRSGRAAEEYNACAKTGERIHWKVSLERIQ
jgi:hypothetical protein